MASVNLITNVTVKLVKVSYKAPSISSTYIFESIYVVEDKALGKGFECCKSNVNAYRTWNRVSEHIAEMMAKRDFKKYDLNNTYTIIEAKCIDPRG